MTESETKQQKPIKAVTNPLLQHGPAGWLINRLQRHALMGWGVAALVIVLHFFIVTVSTLVPRPVLVVDQAGRELGNIEYLKPSIRSDQEIITASMHYLTLCLSLNSSTIYDDFAQCMNLQSPELQLVTKTAIKDDNYLQRIEKVKSRSWLEFGTGANAPVLVDRKGLDARVRLKGNINVDVGGKGIEPKPFDVTLLVRSVARNTKNTSGMLILESRDN
jgi:hypothetical protein